MTTKTTNRLINENSPYLIQHAHNPVDWWPWCDEAFAKAKTEDKPVFLSIGYSTCHWCHVMERESFENPHIAKILNDNYISIKVDKEERPDIDSIYMRVCQAYTGSGGWPTSIFMAPNQRPFYAGTYFPPQKFAELLEIIGQNWHELRDALLRSSDDMTSLLSGNTGVKSSNLQHRQKSAQDLMESAFSTYYRTFDREYGGFGRAPKFPSPHNLLFLMGYATAHDEKNALDMAEKTLMQMYKGGIFDHIGYGFSRYSTDRYWLAPHFEKMLYDNALLAVTYLTAFEQTGNKMYADVAGKIFVYLEREMSNGQGGLYSAQDADSDGVEGKYYVFTPEETIDILGARDGARFNDYFDITQKGNFEDKSIPNLISQTTLSSDMDVFLSKLYEFRLTRTSLHRDEKILTSWNSLSLWAYAAAARITGDKMYLKTAEKLFDFIENNLSTGDTLFVTDAKSCNGFIDDYAFYILALISLYQATFNEKYLNRALELNERVIDDFYDEKDKGFFFYGNESEQLIIRQKESYDGAIPSGNSVMAYNLDRLAKLTKDERLYNMAREQREFMEAEAGEYPAGFSFFLLSTLPTKDIFCALKDENDLTKIKVKSNWVFRVINSPDYPLVNNETTFYICEDGRCLPPANSA
jgi:hypothetical protein